MKTEQDLKEFHEQNIFKYVGKQTQEGVIEELQYFTFISSNGGSYSNMPKINKRGLICGVIGKKKNIPIGELIFI